MKTIRCEVVRVNQVEEWKWRNNGLSSPPLVLDDNVTLAYTNYSTVDGLQYDISQEGIVTYPDNYLINNIHSPLFCGGPFFPVINDATSAATLGKPANLGDQLSAAGIPFVFYAESFNDEVQDAATGDNCKALGTDNKLSSNMLPFTHYARYNPALPPYTNDWLTHFGDVNNGTNSFFSKLAAGTLEPVTWVQPDKRHDWGAGDVSPAASDLWLNSTLQSIFASPQYQANQTLVIVTWSNANGIYDRQTPQTHTQHTVHTPHIDCHSTALTPHCGCPVSLSFTTLLRLLTRSFCILSLRCLPLAALLRRAALCR